MRVAGIDQERRPLSAQSPRHWRRRSIADEEIEDREIGTARFEPVQRLARRNRMMDPHGAGQEQHRLQIQGNERLVLDEENSVKSVGRHIIPRARRTYRLMPPKSCSVRKRTKGFTPLAGLAGRS